MSIKLMLLNTNNVPCVASRMLIENYSNFQIVGESRTSQKAISIVKKTRPDVALIDVSGFKHDVTQILKKLLAIEPNLKIIVLSMSNNRDFISKMFHAGASGYLLKNHAFDNLITAIKHVVTKEHALSLEINPSGMDYLNAYPPLTNADVYPSKIASG
jgi:two-component system, NarL family, response regulator NreC